MTSNAQEHLELLMTADQAVAGWRGLRADNRWSWFQKVYEQAAHLDHRYRLALRIGWWEDDVQIELLATLGAWVAMFAYADWADPEGKARLIFQLPAGRELLPRRRRAVRPRARPRRVRAPPPQPPRLRGARRCSLKKSIPTRAHDA